jgi:formylglycine-generating enzyme required for sulfatase activity
MAQQPPAAKAGDIALNFRDGQKYAWIPAGSSALGCSSGDSQCDRGEPPLHPVTIGKGFWMGQTEVTVGAYKRFVVDTGESLPPDSQWNPSFKDDQKPIVLVAQDEAVLFCAWAGGRVPAEDEWEYAARSRSDAARYGDPDTVAWHRENSGMKGPVAVGQKQPNGWGLYDMLGNVWEWTTGQFPLDSQSNGPNLPPHPDRPFLAIRGGSWSDSVRLIQVSARGRAEIGHRSPNVGFRCVVDNL